MLQPSPLPQPVLSVALPAIEDVKGGEGLSSLWHVFSKCKEFTQDGSRLENISWRLWYRHLHPPGSSYGHCEDYPESNFEQHRRLSVSSGSSFAESSEASTSGSFEETSNASHQQHHASPVSTLLHHQVEAARNASPHPHSSTTSTTAHPQSRRLQSRPSSSVSIQSEPSYFPSNRAGGDLSMTTNTPANGQSSSNRDEGSGSTTPRPPLGTRGHSSPHFAAHGMATHGTASHGSGSTTPHASRHHHPRQQDDAALSFGRVLGQVFREGMSTAGSREMVVERERQRERTRTRSMEIKANTGGLAQHQGTLRCNPISAVSSPNIVMTASPAVPPPASSSASLTLRAARAVVAREKEPLEDEDENERYLTSGPSIHVTDPTPFNTQPNTPETSQRGTPTGPMSPETATMTLKSRAEAENFSSSSTRAGVTSPLATTTTAPLSSPSLHSNSSLASGSSEHIDQSGSLVDSIGTCSSAESALAFTSKRSPQPQQQQQMSQPQPSPPPKSSSPTPSQRDQASSAAAALKRSMFFIQSPGDGGDGASSSSMASSGGAAAPCGHGGGGVAAAGAGTDFESRRIVAGGLGLGMDGYQHDQGTQKQQPQSHPTTTNKGKGKASSTTAIVSPRNSATGRVRSPMSPPSPNSNGRRLSLSAHHPTGRPSEPSPSSSTGVGQSPISPTTSAHLEVSPLSPAGHHLATAPSPLKHGSFSSAAAPTTAAATTTLKPAAIESRHRRRSSASSAGIGLKHTIKSQAATAAKLKRTPSSTNPNSANPNPKKVLSTTTIGTPSIPASKSPDARGSSTFGKRPTLASQTSNMSAVTATSAHKSRTAGPSAAPTTLAMTKTKASSHKSAGGIARPGPGASFTAADDGNSDGYEDESEFDSDEEMDSDEIDDDQEEDDSDDWASDSDDASALAQLAEERAARERAEEAERQRTMFQKVPTSKSQLNLYGLGREAAAAKPSSGGSGASADGLKRMTSSHSSVEATIGSAGEGPTGNIGGGRSSGLLSDMFRIEREKREAAQAALASPPSPPVTTVDQQQPPTLARPRRNSSSQDLWVRTRSGLAMTTGLATATTSATMAGACGLTRNKSSAALPLESGLSVGREPMVSIPQHRHSGPKGEELETDSEDEGQGVPNKLALEASEAQRRLALLSAKRSPSSVSPNGGSSQTQSRLPSGSQKHQQHPPTTRPLPPRPKSPSPLPSFGPVETAAPSAAHVGEPEPPIMGIPQSPRTTRRQMLAAELPEELRKQLLWERMSRQVVGPAAPIVAAHLNRSNSSPRLSQEGSTGISSAGSRPPVSRGVTAPASEGNSRANSPHPSPPDAKTSNTTGNGNGKTTPPAPSLAKRATTSLLASAGLRPLTPSGPPPSGVAQSTTATQPLDGRPSHHHAASASSTVSSASSSRANSRGPPNVHGGPMRRTKSKVYLPTHVYPDQIISHGMGALRSKMEERKAKKAAGVEDDSSSSDEEDEELEAQIALQRSRTHTGALNYMIPDDDRTWDADYRSHGF